MSIYLQEELVEALLAEAMSWVNTPFEHQGKLKKQGVDCVHFVDICLIKTVGQKLGLNITIPHNYNPKEDGSVLLGMLDDLLEFVPTEERRRGDIAAFIDPDLRGKNVPSHLAFVEVVTNVTTYIIEAGKRGVVRHRMDGMWMKRIHSVWRIELAKLEAYRAANSITSTG